MTIPKDKLRFMSWREQNYTINSPIQVGTDNMILDDMSIQREEPTNTDSNTIYLSKEGSDSNAGTSENPVLTLDKALSLLTHMKTQIIIQDSEEYITPVTLSENSRGGLTYDDISYLSGIYAKEGMYPTLKDSETLHQSLDLAANPLSTSKLPSYGDYYYIFHVGLGGAVLISKVNIYTHERSSVSWDTHEVNSTTTFLTTTDGKIKWTSEDTLYTWNTTTDTLTTDVLSPSSPTGYMIAQFGYHNDSNPDLTFVIDRDVSSENIKVYELDGTTLTLFDTTDTITDLSHVEDFYLEYINGVEYLYIAYGTKDAEDISQFFLSCYEVNRSAGTVDLLSENEIIVNTWGAGDRLQHHFYKVNEDVFFPTKEGLYKIRMGGIEKVSPLPILSHTFIAGLTIAILDPYLGSIKYSLRPDNKVNVHVLNKEDLTLIEAGEIFNPVSEPGDYVFLTHIHNFKGNVVLSPFHNATDHYIFRYSLTQFDFNYVSDKPLLAIKADEEVSGSTFTESSGRENTVTLVGSGINQTNATQSKGKYSFQFNGTDDKLTSPDSDIYDIGTNKFYLKVNVNFDTVPDSSDYVGLVDINDGTTNGLGLFYWGGTLRLFIGGTQIYKSFSVTAGTWYEFEIKRINDTVYMYVDGEQIHAAANSTDVTGGSGGVIVGSSQNWSAKWVDGYMDDIVFSLQPTRQVNFEGLQFHSRYANKCISAPNNYVDLHFKYCYFKDFESALDYNRLSIENCWFENCDKVIYNDEESHLYTNSEYLKFYLKYNIIKNSVDGMYINYDSIKHMRYFQILYNTFVNFGLFNVTFDSESTIDHQTGTFDPLDFYHNILSNTYYKDYGTVTFPDQESMRLSNNLFDKTLYFIGNIETEIGGVNEIPLFIDYEENLRLRNYEEGFNPDFTNTYSKGVGSYQQNYTGSKETNIIIDLPLPSSIEIHDDFKVKNIDTTLGGHHVKNVETKIRRFTLIWNELEKFTPEDYNNYLLLKQNNTLFEVFLSGIDRVEGSLDISGDPAYFTLSDKIYIDYLSLGRLIGFGTESGYGVVKYIHDYKIELEEYFEAADNLTKGQKGLYDPLTLTDKYLRGFLCVIKPKEETFTCPIVENHNMLKNVKQIGSLSIELYCLLKPNLEFLGF